MNTLLIIVAIALYLIVGAVFAMFDALGCAFEGRRQTARDIAACVLAWPVLLVVIAFEIWKDGRR